MYRWVVCSGRGYLYKNENKEKRISYFNKDSVCLVKGDYDINNFLVWAISTDILWVVAKADTQEIDVKATGDKFDKKICNICHCVKPIEHFARNQNNIHGIVRRPSCRKCRTDIDKRPPRTKQAKEMEKNKPKLGTPFQCPICQKRSIVGVTAKIVADHDHHTGNIRDWLCDSCNTGLGRFKNGNNYLMNAVEYINERDTLRH